MGWVLRFESTKEEIIQSLGIEFKPTKGGKNMREILSDKGSVRIGRISELSSDINKLYTMTYNTKAEELE